MQVMSFQEQSFHVAFMPDGAVIAHNKQINPGQAAWQPGFANQGRPAPFSVELKAHVSKVHVTAGEQRLDRDPQDLFDEYHSFPKGREQIAVVLQDGHDQTGKNRCPHAPRTDLIRNGHAKPTKIGHLGRL